MHKALLCIAIVLVSGKLYAQTAKPKEEASKTTLTLAAIYSNNVSYYGQSTSDKLPYLLGNATLRLPDGIYCSAGAYKLTNIGGGISETDLGVGYAHDFSEQFNADISFTRSFFPKNSPLLQASNENNANFTANYNWPWFKSSLSADYAFGQENDFFVGFSNSKNIDLCTVFDENDQLSIEPAVEIVAGTQHFFNTYKQEKIKRNNGKGNGAANGNGNGKTETITTSKSSFNVLTYNFKLPLTYSRSVYLAEIAYQFSLISNTAITEAKKQQSYLSISFYYQF
jgi:hypothetical protein